MYADIWYMSMKNHSLSHILCEGQDLGGSCQYVQTTKPIRSADSPTDSIAISWNGTKHHATQRWAISVWLIEIMEAFLVSVSWEVYTHKFCVWSTVSNHFQFWELRKTYHNSCIKFKTKFVVGRFGEEIYRVLFATISVGFNIFATSSRWKIGQMCFLGWV